MIHGIPRPDIDSPEVAANSVQGQPIVYTATAADTTGATLNWTVVDDGGATGVVINTSTGVMTGGDAVPAGTYRISLAAATVFGRDCFHVEWTVT